MSEDNPVYGKDPRFEDGNPLFSSDMQHNKNPLLDIDIYENVKSMGIKQVKQVKQVKLLFIDLDKTLIEPSSGNVHPEWIGDLQFKMDTVNAILKLEPHNVIIVSNQGGIELGYVDLAYFKQKISFVANALEDYFINKHGADISVNGIFCESNDPKNIYRKPNTGMLSISVKNLKEMFNLEYDKSEMLMVGDASGSFDSHSDADILTANNFGIDYLDVKQFCKLMQ